MDLPPPAVPIGHERAPTAPTSDGRPDLPWLRQAVDSCSEIIFMTDREGLFTFVNPAFERCYGYSSSDVVGRVTPRLLKGGDASEDWHPRFWQQLALGDTVERAWINRAKDGQLMDIESSTSAVRDEARSIVGFIAVQRVVTADKRAARELRVQQAALAIERDLSLDGILVMDDRSRVVSFNRRFKEMWRLSTECLESRDDTVLLEAIIGQLAGPVQFLQRVHEFYNRRDEVAHDEVVLNDGRIFDRYSVPTSARDSGYYGRVWYFRDVTERKQAELILRQERDRAQSYLDVADVILLALDLESRITLINRKGCSIMGWREDELLGRNWIQTCLPARSRDSLTASLHNLQRGDVRAVESTVLTRSGEERLIAWRNTVLCDHAGAVIGTFSSGTDITEKHQAIEALRTAEERMRFALQNADVGIWDMNYTTGALQWSETIEAHYGVPAGTFAGTFEAFVERIHPADRASVLETVSQATRSGADFRVEHRSMWPDGTVHWLSGAGRTHFGANGEPVRALGISLDVTHRKELELELLQAQKLESVGRLASGVAHEINTPIQFVSDSIHFVRDAMADLIELIAKYRAVNDAVIADLPARAAADAAVSAEQVLDLAYTLANVPAALDRSIDGLNRVAVIVRSMKDFAYPDRTEMAAVDLNQAIQSTLTIASHELKYVAEVETDFGSIPPVTCHRGDVNQAVLNIIVNAAHAIGDSIKGTTARGCIVVRTRSDGDDVVVRISDNGGGIPEAIRERVFDPFFTTKDVGSGTGQGLAIARSVIVEKHRGTLTFETEIGRGTTFVIRLPVNAPSGSPATTCPIPSLP
jgi:two-component system NtrC family sensor kinase